MLICTLWVDRKSPDGNNIYKDGSEIKVDTLSLNVLQAAGEPMLLFQHYQGSVPSFACENVPVGPSGPSNARRTASRAPSSTVSVPS